jgi:glutamine cyclotransferase
MITGPFIPGSRQPSDQVTTPHCNFITAAVCLIACLFSARGDIITMTPPQAVFRHDRSAWTEGLVCSANGGRLRVWESVGMWGRSDLRTWESESALDTLTSSRRATARRVGRVALPGLLFAEGVALRPVDGVLYQATYQDGIVLRFHADSLASAGEPLLLPDYVAPGPLPEDAFEWAPLAAIGRGETMSREVWGAAWDFERDELVLSNGTLILSALSLKPEPRSALGLHAVATTLVTGVLRSDAAAACESGGGKRTQYLAKSFGLQSDTVLTPATADPWWPVRINELEYIPAPAARRLIALFREDCSSSHSAGAKPGNQSGFDASGSRAELWAAVQSCSSGLLRLDARSGVVLGWLRLPQGWEHHENDLNGIAVCEYLNKGRTGPLAAAPSTESVLVLTGKNWGQALLWRAPEVRRCR